MVIEVKELYKAIELILSHLEQSGQSQFEINDDYYWAISNDESYNPYITPTRLTLGQLTDDWNEISSILDGKKEPLGYSLVWISAIMKRIGELSVG